MYCIPFIVSCVILNLNIMLRMYACRYLIVTSLCLHRWGGDPANTQDLYTICTMLDQRRRRRDDLVQMLYKCFVLAGSKKLCLLWSS